MLQQFVHNPIDTLINNRSSYAPENYPYSPLSAIAEDSTITQVWAAHKITSTTQPPVVFKAKTRGEQYADGCIVLFLIIFFLIASERIVEGIITAFRAALNLRKQFEADDELTLRTSRLITVAFVLPTAVFALSPSPTYFFIILACILGYFAVMSGFMAILDYVNHSTAFGFINRIRSNYVIIASAFLLLGKINMLWATLCAIPFIIFLVMASKVVIKNNFSVFFYILYICTLELLPAILVFRYILK